MGERNEHFRSDKDKALIMVLTNRRLHLQEQVFREFLSTKDVFITQIG